jgi:hypothetical protein
MIPHPICMADLREITTDETNIFSASDAVNRLLHPATENNTVTRTEQERPPVVSQIHTTSDPETPPAVKNDHKSDLSLPLIIKPFKKGRFVIEHQPLVIGILSCNGNVSLLFDFIIFILRKPKGNQPRNKPNSLSYM